VSLDLLVLHFCDWTKNINTDENYTRASIILALFPYFPVLIMSTTVIVSRLTVLVEKVEGMIRNLDSIRSRQQGEVLEALSERLSKSATAIQEKAETIKATRVGEAWEQSEKYRAQARSARATSLSEKRLSNPVTFRRNIVLIFEGPKDSSFDSTEIKSRKASTRKRCEVIRHLPPDGVLSWANAFPPTLWASGSMTNNIFECLIDDILPDGNVTWPDVIWDTLQKLQTEETSLHSSAQYDECLNC